VVPLPSVCVIGATSSEIAAVERTGIAADGTWEVMLESGETRSYDGSILANGHHWDPRRPEPFPGSEEFAVLEIHWHDYKGDDSELFRDRNVAGYPKHVHVPSAATDGTRAMPHHVRTAVHHRLREGSR